MRENCSLCKPSVIDSEVSDTAYIAPGSRIIETSLGNHVRVGRGNWVFKSTIDRRTYTGQNSIIAAATIGAFCSISWNVTVGAANHDFHRVTQHSFLYDSHNSDLRPSGLSASYDRFEQGSVLGADVWVGAGAVILQGVTVGNGAVIGANSVVTRDVPPYAVSVGVPSRVVNWRFSEDRISLLEKLEWWTWTDSKIRENYDLLSGQNPSSQI